MKAAAAIAERFKKIMAEKGVTKKELIKYCKLSSKTINNVLQGKSDKVSSTTLFKLMKYLNVEPSEFFNDNLIDNLD